MKRYNPSEIEPKWQKIWQETNVYTTDFESEKPKYIAMSMFNYPSGAGIHVGHAMNFTISDVKARFKRQQGYESYNPVGWDSFGLPAENYAIKAGVSPQESMATIIPSYHKQYQAMGWSNDWEKEITTSVPEYYKWTQWIFSKMYEHGLAYQDARMQWWCGKCQTVLANEQVTSANKCWRHEGKDDPVIEKKQIKQWFFKITEYADEILKATDDLDWTESVKLAQKNWIGRSEGAEIDFAIESSKNVSIKVFTTRPDTLFGATFLVLAPEHELVNNITTTEQQEAVADYIKQTAKKTELERQSGNDKTGVFTGTYAVNPVNNEKIPIWIADYVLSGYGTGAIMAVPAHDQRDYEFAQKYNLDIIRVIDNQSSDDEFTQDSGILVNSGIYNGLESSEATIKIVKDLQDKGMAKKVVNYKMRDWSVSRQRYWGAPIPIIHCQKCDVVPVPEKDLPVILPELSDFKPSGDGRSALARAKDWLMVDCPKCGGKAERDTDTIDTYVCSSWYMLRFIDPHNQQEIFSSERANKWMPVDFYNGGDHAVAHLLYARFITRFFHKIGLLDNPEPFKQMLFNGKVTASDGAAFSKTLGNGPDPLKIIDSGYGADALRIYLMFAAPLEFGARWDEQGVPGAYRYLNRLWTLTQDYLESKTIDDLSVDAIKKLKFATNNLVKKATRDLENNKYNTAIASCMEQLNDLYKYKVSLPFGKNPIWQGAIEANIACIAPFAPHIADELWQQLGHSISIQKDSWPELDISTLDKDIITIIVQVNGKLRAKLSLDKNSSEEEVTNSALSQPHVQSFIGDKKPIKIIYISQKLINIVV